MTTTKAKRKLSNIDFSADGAHVALVGKAQGGPANGHNYALIMKSANFSDEFIKKAAMITVTLEITEFLEKFFGLYGSDAEVLARTLGFTTEMQEEEANETDESDGSYDDWYENYIEQQVQSFSLMKSMYEAEDVTNVLSTLTEDQYLEVLKDQSKLEKALEIIEKAKMAKTKPTTKTKKTKTTRGYTADTSTDVVSASVSKAQKENKVMLEQELIEKSAALQKALDEINIYKAKEKEAITKARFAEVKEAVVDEEKAKVLFKALDLVQEPSEFTAIVKVLGELTALVEKSELFTEKGVAVKEDTPVVKESAVAKAVKAEITKQSKLKQ